MTAVLPQSAGAVPDDDWTAAVAAARAFEARHETIDGFRYPDGIRIAVNFTADFDAMLFRRALDEPPMQKAKGEYGGRVGIWRLIELFDAHGVKATFFTPGRICELYPQALRAAAASGHELADHMWEHLTPKTDALQRDHIRKTADALAQIGGVRPIGTRSYYQQAHLKEAGYLYNSEGRSSRLPYYAADANVENCLLILPFHFSIDDAQFYNFGWFTSEPSAQRLTDPERIMEMWWDAFEQQYETGNGYLNICLHPFVSGRALRTHLLGQLIERMKGKEGVWFPTCAQLARYVLDRFPPQSLKF
ncbi:MAG: polysaccharide deacetylase family protein [Gammaproteobacteria bacterium]|nr:polysaccharide deacetylase family protein [Gammaproteobacteria bacterium]MBU1440833.1 polysaccharide deacetylase family protein [Gammaproteobacteria bacterium]MBU2284975.1 polysaccharide deacetylase family protein [Gammaproteobacteria bacterium]MBU2410024.1 polysaccharide deacetylase family protein [Gammaproteobacteria bacterium]